MTRRFFRWFFESRVTGAITIAQAPNFFLWIVIVAGALIWAWHPPDQVGVALKVIFRGALFVWAPTRSCAGSIRGAADVRSKSLPFNNRERASAFRSAGAQLLVGLQGATVPVFVLMLP